MPPKNPNNNIENALGSLTDALEIEPTGEEIQLEPDQNIVRPSIIYYIFL